MTALVVAGLAIILGGMMLVLLVVGLAATAGPVGWVLLMLAGGGAVVAGRRKKARKEAEKEAKKARREADQRAREQKARERRARRTDRLARHRGHPVGSDTPLPRRWSRPPRQARAAVNNYGQAVEALRPSPQRERLRQQGRYLSERARDCDQTARRAAELDRQLRNLDKDDREDGSTLHASVQQAEARLTAVVAELDELALQAAHVCLTQSVEDMEVLERTTQALQHDLDVTAKEHR